MKAIAYTVLAMILGLSIVVGPVVVLTATRGEDVLSEPPQWFSNSFKGNIREVEGTYENRSTVSQVDVGFLAIVSIAALLIYLVIGRMMPNREYKMSRFPT